MKTSYGSLSVAVFGDWDNPALITYPDLALNCKTMSSKSTRVKYEFAVTWLNIKTIYLEACCNPADTHSYCAIFHRKHFFKILFMKNVTL